MSETVAVDPEQVADVLEAAADLIDTFGWTQGRYSEVDGTRCLVGAIRKAKNDLACAYIVSSFARSAVAIQIQTACLEVWNDEPGREVWEVTDLLRATAKKVRHGDLSVA